MALIGGELVEKTVVGGDGGKGVHRKVSLVPRPFETPSSRKLESQAGVRMRPEQQESRQFHGDLYDKQSEELSSHRHEDPH